MKNSLILSILILFSFFNVHGQAHKSEGLYLTGSIVDLRPIAECSGSEGRILMQIELSMQFRNSSDRPLIVFKPELFLPTRWSRTPSSTRILFLRSLPSTTDKESERIQVNHIPMSDCHSSGYSSYSNYDPVADFIERINLPTPSPGNFTVVEPRGYHEFRDYVMVDASYEVEVKLGKSLKEARARSIYPAFQIQYHLSVKGHAKGEGLLESLRSKWKPVGNFVLDANGDFTVTSEPIINRSVE